jgi:hypothetical protein
MTSPLKDMIAELRRELRHRRTVYPSLVKRGALSEEPIGQSPPACSRNDQNRKPTAPLLAMGTKRQNRIALNLSTRPAPTSLQRLGEKSAARSPSARRSACGPRPTPRPTAGHRAKAVARIERIWLSFLRSVLRSRRQNIGYEKAHDSP